jgi:GTP-binding protein EngB required for normal cell division
MAADLTAALEALDLAVARAAAVVGDEAVEPFGAVSLNARRRVGFLGDTVVIALGGGTGVGKSSLLNAIAGEPVALTGPRRPTTDRPLAWIPSNAEPGLTRLLDDLGIEDRVGQTSDPHLAVLDLPDFDSVVGAHRETVERLLPRVDVVMWIVDPEKYNDRTIHAHYLRPLAAYQGQFVFILNQIDRLMGEDLDVLLADLEQTLWRDGIVQPVIFPLAAAPPDADPVGLDPLHFYLREQLNAKRLAIAKLLEDLRRAGRGLSETTGVTPGTGLQYDERWETVSHATTGILADMVAGPAVAAVSERAGEKSARRIGGGPVGKALATMRRSPVGRALGAGSEEEVIQEETRQWEGRVGLERALAGLGELVTDLSFEAGGAFGAKLRDRFTDRELQYQLRGSIEGALAKVKEPGAPRPRRWWPVAGAMQTLLFLALVGCGVWIWARPDSLERGTWPWPLIVGAAAVLLSILLSALIRRSGRRSGSATAGAYRAAVEHALSEQLSRRIGVPFRTLVRERAEFEGALAELSLQVARVESRAADDA